MEVIAVVDNEIMEVIAFVDNEIMEVIAVGSIGSCAALSQLRLPDLPRSEPLQAVALRCRC
jgi:hypothetical protein